MTATFNPYGGGWIGGKASAQQGMIAVMNKSNTHLFRYQCHWSSMETSPGVIDWSDVDDLVAVAQANNYLILFPIQDAPSWHTIPLYGNPTKSIPDPAAAGHFCDLLLSRYAPGTFYSIEVNNEGFNSGQLFSQIFTDQMKPMINYIKASIAAHSPGTLCGAPAELNNDPNVIVTWAQFFYQSGCGQLCDYANIHYYPGTSPDTGSSTKATFKQRVAAFTDAAAPYNFTHPRGIWVTETSWVRINAAGTNGGLPDATIATNITQILTEAMNSGSVQALVYFNINDIAPGFTNQNFSLQEYAAWADFIAAHPQWPSGGGGGGTGGGGGGGGTIAAPHVMVVMMENRPTSGVIGSTGRAANWPHTNALASTYSYCPFYYSTGHPSLPGYLSIISGSTHGVTSDGTPSGVGGPYSGNMFTDELAAANIGWRAYFEASSPSYVTGYLGGDTGTAQTGYTQHHNPFVYFKTITANTAQANNMVNWTQSGMVADLNAANPPSFIWFTPDKLDQGHDDTTAEDTAADNFLNTFIPAIQATTWYANNGIIIILWDEGSSTDNQGIGDANPGGGNCPCIVVSEFAKSLPNMTTPINHFGLLRGLCKLYNVGLLNNANHTTDGDLTPLLGTGSSGGGGGTGTFTASPSTLPFSAIASGSNPSNRTVTLSNTTGSGAAWTNAITYGTGQTTGWLSISPTSGTVAASSTSPITVSVNITGLVAATYNASITFTSGTMTFSVTVTLVVTPASITATPLTLYMTNGQSASIALANTMLANATTGGSLKAHGEKIGTATGYGELNTGNTSWPSASSIGSPSGNGWLLDDTSLEGQTLQAGNWTPTRRYKVSNGSIIADIYLSIFVWQAGTYTLIGSPLALLGQTITTTQADYTFAATSLPAQALVTGQKLYIDEWFNITTNSTGSSTATVTTYMALTGGNVVTDSQMTSPGFIATSTGGSGGGGGGGTGTGGGGAGTGAGGSPPPAPPPVGAFTVYVDSVPVESIAGTLQVDNAIGRRSTASVKLITDTNTHFQQYQAFAIYDANAQLVFNGFITSPEETKPGFQNVLVHTITATDQHFIADKRVIAQAYVNKTCGFIAQDIYNTILSQEGIAIGQIFDGLEPAVALYPSTTLYPSGNVGPVPQATFAYCTVAQALDALVTTASEAGVPYYWMIDGFLNFFFVPYTAIINTTVIDGTQIDQVYNPPIVKRANPLYRNTQIVVGATAQTVAQDEVQNGDGHKRSFPMGYELSSKPNITVNGTVQTVALKGSTGFQFYWAQGDPVVTQDPGELVLTGTDVLECIYIGQYPTAIIDFNGAQIAYQSSIDNTSGIIEEVETDRTLNSVASGLVKVSQLLTRYGKQGTILQCHTLSAGFAPGQLVMVNLPAHGLANVQMLIEEVSISDQLDQFNLWYTIKAVLGPYDTSWVNFFSTLLSYSQPANTINVGVSQSVPLLSNFVAQIGVTATLNTVNVNACPLPSTGLFPSTTLFPC